MLVGTLVRASLLALVGVLIGAVDSGIAVILVYYAVLFVAAVPFLALRTGPLLATALAWGLLAPVASMALRRRIAPPTYDVPSLDSFAAPAGSFRGLPHAVPAPLSSSSFWVFFAGPGRGSSL